MKSLFLKFSYYSLEKECPKQGWQIPTSEEVKNSDIMHDVVWVSDPVPSDEDDDRAYLYVKSKDTFEICNKSHGHHCVVNKIPCGWKRSSDVDTAFQTMCGEMFVLTNSEPLINNGYKYCPHCGKEIEELFDE